MGEGYTATRDEYNDLAQEYRTSLLSQACNETTSALLARLNTRSPLAQAKSILDIGAGPGLTFTHVIRDYGHDISKDIHLTALDESTAMVAQIEKAKAAEVQKEPSSLWANVEIIAGDAQDLTPLEDNAYSHVTAGLVIFLLPNARQALREIHRVLKKDDEGGCFAMSCWPRSQWQDLVKILGEIRPDKTPYSVPVAWASVENVRAELEATGFVDVQVDEAEIKTTFESPEEACKWLIEYIPYLVKSTKDMSATEVEELKNAMATRLMQMSGSGHGRGEMLGTAIVATGRSKNS